MKYIEIDSRKFWFFHYKMDATLDEVLDNVNINIYDNPNGSRQNKNVENTYPDFLSLNLYSKNVIGDNENQLKEDFMDYYDNYKKDGHLFKNQCKALLNNEIDYFVSKLSFETVSKEYMIEDVSKIFKNGNTIENLKFSQITKVDYAEFFISEKNSLDLETILKWTKRIMKEQFNFHGEFEIINSPSKEEVEKDYDDFIYDVLEPEYNKDNIKYTIQSHRFLLIFLIFVLIISRFKPIDHHAITMILFVTLGGILYPRYRLTKDKASLVAIVAILISTLFRLSIILGIF